VPKKTGTPTTDILSAPRTWWILFAVWLTTLTVLSSFPVPDLEQENLKISDKLVHFLYFMGGAGAFNLARGLAGTRLVGWVAFGVNLLVFALIGAGDEFHQSFVEGRTGNDLGDFLADVLGGIGGYIAAVITLALFGRFLNRPLSV